MMYRAKMTHTIAAVTPIGNTCRPIDNGPHPYAIGQYALKTKTGPVRYICVPNDTNTRTGKFGINQSLGGMSA